MRVISLSMDLVLDSSIMNLKSAMSSLGTTHATGAWMRRSSTLAVLASDSLREEVSGCNRGCTTRT